MKWCAREGEYSIVSTSGSEGINKKTLARAYRRNAHRHIYEFECTENKHKYTGFHSAVMAVCYPFTFIKLSASGRDNICCELERAEREPGIVNASRAASTKAHSSHPKIHSHFRLFVCLFTVASIDALIPARFSGPCHFGRFFSLSFPSILHFLYTYSNKRTENIVFFSLYSRPFFSTTAKIFIFHFSSCVRSFVFHVIRLRPISDVECSFFHPFDGVPYCSISLLINFRFGFFNALEPFHYNNYALEVLKYHYVHNSLCVLFSFFFSPSFVLFFRRVFCCPLMFRARFFFFATQYSVLAISNT